MRKKRKKGSSCKRLDASSAKVKRASQNSLVELTNGSRRIFKKIDINKMAKAVAMPSKLVAGN